MALGAAGQRLAFAAGVEPRQRADDVRHVAAHDRPGDELDRVLGRPRQRSQPAHPGVFPAVAVEHLERAHRQPVALLEAVAVGERAGGGDLAQQGGLGVVVDADLGERALGCLIGIAAQQPEGGRQLIGDLVQDQVVVVTRWGIGHRRQR